jgi:hypothetical protein
LQDYKFPANKCSSSIVCKSNYFKCYSSKVDFLQFLSIYQKPVLPVVVIDQINMWQAEKNRFKFTDGVFYGQFNTSRDYEMLKKYAKVISMFKRE